MFSLNPFDGGREDPDGTWAATTLSVVYISGERGRIRNESVEIVAPTCKCKPSSFRFVHSPIIACFHHSMHTTTLDSQVQTDAERAALKRKLDYQRKFNDILSTSGFKALSPPPGEPDIFWGGRIAS